LGDRVEKWNFHLEDLKLEIHVEEVRRSVSMKEKDLRMEPHSTLRPPVDGEESWRCEPPTGLCPRRE
jgi:hypothetical protein